MGILFKSDIEKLIKDARKTSLNAGPNEDGLSHGDRMRRAIAKRMGTEKYWGQRIEGMYTADSIFLKPIHMLTKHGREIEKNLEARGSEEYYEQFKQDTWDARALDRWERGDFGETADRRGIVYDYRREDIVDDQDSKQTHYRNGFHMNRGQNHVVIDLVLTGRGLAPTEDEHGNINKVVSGAGELVSTGQKAEQLLTLEEQKKYNVVGEGKAWVDDITFRKQDEFRVAYAERVREAEAINKAVLEELGYDLLPPDHEGYIAQQMEIAGDERFIETFPDLSGLPPMYGDDGKEIQPEYDIVIHINGKKVQPQDMNLAFNQLSRYAEYNLTGFEQGRDYLIEQGIRGASFHASAIPQRMATDMIKMPAREAQEGERALTGILGRQLLQALSQGISR